MKYSKILLIFLFTGLFSTSIWAQDKNEDSSKYNIPNLSILDSLVGNYRVFLTGENHTYYYVNNSVKLQMLKYLHEKKGVKDMVIELGFARGFLIDKYINEDSSYINLLNRTTAYQYIEFYNDLRKWNLSLPVEERVHIHGVDVERFPDDAPVLMADILKKDSTPRPESIQFLSDVIISYAEYKQSGISYENYYDYYDSYYFSYGLSDEMTLDSMLVDYKVIREDFKTYLGDKFEVFDKSMKSLEEYRKYKKYARTPQQYVYRERFMYKNMIELLESDSNRNIFGQFGRCHVGLNQVMNGCEWYDHSPMARRVNESKYKGQVLNIAIFYGSQYSSLYDPIIDESINVYSYSDSMGNDVCKLFALSEDSLKNKNYEYLIYCRLSKIKTKVKTKFKSDNVSSFDLFGGVSRFNFSRLNQAIDPSGKEMFKNDIKCFGLGFSVLSENVFVGFDFVGFEEMNLNVSNYKYHLFGFSISEKIGFSPQFSKHLSFSPHFIINYSRFNLNVTNDSIPSFVIPGFASSKTEKFVNGALALGAGINMKLGIGRSVALSFNGHILADPSYKNWRRVEGGVNPLDSTSPKTSLFNFGFSVGLSWMFYENYYY
ncbi:MAG: hypothetical protein IT245_00160 [Bacteroidia bacterium]|nr:hypothetical protein [Bacteroidia bacterium]